MAAARITRRLFGAALAAVLGWQVAAGAVALVHAVDLGRSTTLHLRLTATTAERVARVLGEDAAIHRAVRETLPERALLLVQAPTALASASLQDLPQVRLLHQLKNLLYPILVANVPDPQRVVDDPRAGDEVWLLRLDHAAIAAGAPAEPVPAEPTLDPLPPPWQPVVRGRRFELWRHRRS